MDKHTCTLTSTVSLPPSLLQTTEPPTTPTLSLVEETARLVEDPAHSDQCLQFVQQVGEVEENLKGTMDKISQLCVPREPDLEKVHNGIDQYQVASGRGHVLCYVYMYEGLEE